MENAENGTSMKSLIDKKEVLDVDSLKNIANKYHLSPADSNELSLLVNDILHATNYEEVARLVVDFHYLLDVKLRKNCNNSITILSPREREVYSLIVKGQNNKAIAKLLSISPHTVGDYVKVIYKKLGVCSRSEVAFKFPLVELS